MQFSLRSWTLNDLDSLVRHANNKKIADNMMDRFPHPYTAEAGTEFIRRAISDPSGHILAIDIGGEAAGGIGLHTLPDIYCLNAELGYWLAEPFWGKGIIPRAIGQMVEYGFSRMNINRIFARPFGTNLASQRVLEKAGFTLEARFEKTILKNGVLLDELVYAIRKRTP